MIAFHLASILKSNSKAGSSLCSSSKCITSNSESNVIWAVCSYAAYTYMYRLKTVPGTGCTGVLRMHICHTGVAPVTPYTVQMLLVLEYQESQEGAVYYHLYVPVNEWVWVLVYWSTVYCSFPFQNPRRVLSFDALVVVAAVKSTVNCQLCVTRLIACDHIHPGQTLSNEE